jgi:GntR family transcriptional regulator
MNIKKTRKISGNNLPLYSRVESIIRNKIMNGQLLPGEMMPKEQDLTVQFNVSQITIRTALSHLKDEGLIVRSRAKGTFVAESIPEKNQLFLEFNDIYDIVRSASKYKVKVLEYTKSTVHSARYPQDVAKFFSVPGDNEIYILKRIRSLGNIPIILLENHIPVDIGKNLTTKDLTQRPILKTLKDKIGLSVNRGQFFVEAIPAEPDIAETLVTELFEPIISMKVYYWMSPDKPFEVVNLFMRADYFKFKGNISASQFKDL